MEMENNNTPVEQPPQTETDTTPTNQEPTIQNNAPVEQTPAIVNKVNKRLTAGIVFFNLALTCIIFGVLSFISPIIQLLFYLIMLVIIIFVVVFTLGLIFVVNQNVVPTLWNILTSGGEFIQKLSTLMFTALPYVAGAGVLFSVLAIIFLAVNKSKKQVTRIVFSVIFIVLIAVVTALYLINTYYQG